MKESKTNRRKHFLLLNLLIAFASVFAAQSADSPAVDPVGKPESPPPATSRNQESATKQVVSDADRPLRMNFRGATLEMVLNYLSEAAGFTIVLETKLEGKIDAWSNQPLNKTEAVDLLNAVLNKNGYAAIQNGRTLTIVGRDEAKKRNIPVKVGSDPKSIPKNDEMVTQIIPVRYANALQLTKDLTPLLPTFANLTANESGNALVLTDTQADIHRMAEIVKALDTSIASISTIRVFPLRFADAKDLANAVKEVFTPPTSQQGNNNNRNQFNNRFGGGRGGGGFPGGAGGGGFPGGFPGGGGGGGGGGADPNAGTGVSEARNAASRVVAIADERSNSLVVSAPDELVPSIEQLVKELDVTVADITELRVFHLVNSDPLEIVDLFSQLFPDDSKTSADQQNQNPFGFRFNPGGPGGIARGGQTQGDTSTRAKKKGQVLAVADQRTSSVIVSAASESMPQIAEMVAQLDSSPARKQKVFVYSLQNADPQQAEQVLQTMFQRTTTSQSRNSQNQNSALTTRSTANQTTTTGTGLGSSGLGNTGLGNSSGSGLGNSTLR